MRGTGKDTSPSEAGVNSYIRGTGQDTKPLDAGVNSCTCEVQDWILIQDHQIPWGE
jgi:hypothetical protein